MTYRPLIKGWQLYFKEKDGYNNRKRILEVLVNFLNDESRKIVKLPGYCQLGGKIYGHEKFTDGEFILTLEIAYIVREGAILAAITPYGKRYYFRPDEDEMNSFMRRMVNDCKNGAINSKRWFYLPPRMMKQKDRSFL